MSESLAAAAERFVMHRRALGRKYISEEHELRHLVRFADVHGIGDLDQLRHSHWRRSWRRDPDTVPAASTTSSVCYHSSRSTGDK